MITTRRYSMKLQNGLGVIDETKILLDLWEPGMSATELRRIALESGLFPTMSARRLRNIINDCFAPRYLVNNAQPALHLKQLKESLLPREVSQLLFLFTCRAHLILSEFVREVYWPRYASGSPELSNEDSRKFVEQLIVNQTASRWSADTIRRAAGDLTACCADFGLLERGGRTRRKILPFRITPKAALYLAHELHLSGVSDNVLVNHEDWRLFGLVRQDVIDELKKLSLKGFFIVQSAGDFIRIAWKFSTMEEVCDVLSKN